MHEVQAWDREEFSIYKALSEDERGGSAEVKQEDEGYSVSLKGRQATVHPYRQGMYAVIKEEEVKKEDFFPRTMGRYRRLLH